MSKNTNNYSRKAFQATDTNNDNFVTEKEMAEYFKKAYCGKWSDDCCKIVAQNNIKAADIDGNKKMSLGEYALAVENTQQINRADFEAKYGKEEADILFNKYNKDCDVNTITQEEVKAVDKEMDKSKGGLSGWAIAGIVIGSIVVVGLIIALIVALAKRNNKAKVANKVKVEKDDTKKKKKKKKVDIEEDEDEEEDEEEEKGNSCDKKNDEARYKTNSVKGRTKAHA